jgi:hypothetical protein
MMVEFALKMTDFMIQDLSDYEVDNSTAPAQISLVRHTEELNQYIQDIVNNICRL